MDALLFMVLALVRVLMVSKEEPKVRLDECIESESGVTERVAKLNDLFYEDEDAFSEIIHALGFPRR